MKKIISIFFCSIVMISCHKNLLDQPATDRPVPTTFWKSENDATIALQGLYSAARPCFDRDYYMDGHAEYFRCRGVSSTVGNLRLGDAYQSSNTGGMFGPTGYGQYFDNMYKYLYGVVDNANYVIANVTKMQASSATFGASAVLQTIQGESRLLRALAYFKLISMWGDVPYYTFAPTTNDQVQGLKRLPIGQVKDSILADLTLPSITCPIPPTNLRWDVHPGSQPWLYAERSICTGVPGTRMAGPSWKALHPMAQLRQPPLLPPPQIFAPWQKDYPSVTLYLNGDPGQIDSLGKADLLPNYFNLFMPKANGNPEMLLVFTHGGTGTGQGEELMRDFSGRSHEGSQCWVAPRYEIADRYQLLTTGDFAAKLIPMNPTVPRHGHCRQDYTRICGQSEKLFQSRLSHEIYYSMGL